MGILPSGEWSEDDFDVLDTSLIFEFPAPSEKLLAEVFGLTPAEARLAQRIARGDSLEDIAADAGIKMPTARCQLASVFGKTGTHRQPKLVALLCRLAYLSAGHHEDRTPRIS